MKRIFAVALVIAVASGALFATATSDGADDPLVQYLSPGLIPVMIGLVLNRIIRVVKIYHIVIFLVILFLFAGFRPS